MATSVLDPPSLRLARVIAVCALGLSAGAMATVPFLSLPVLFSSPMTADVRLRTWSRLYSRFASFMKPFILVTAALQAFTAYGVREPGGLVYGGWWSSNRKALLALAAVLNLGIAPYSMLCLGPVDRRLKKAEVEMAKHTSDEDKSASAHVTTSLLHRWSRIYVGKVVLGVAALGVAAGELGFA